MWSNRRYNSQRRRKCSPVTVLSWSVNYMPSTYFLQSPIDLCRWTRENRASQGAWLPRQDTPPETAWSLCPKGQANNRCLTKASVHVADMLGKVQFHVGESSLSQIPFQQTPLSEESRRANPLIIACNCWGFSEKSRFSFKQDPSECCK